MWGSAGTGKCGLGEITNTVECYCSIPTRVLVGPEDRKVRRLSCGSAHTACVTENGSMYIFGCGDGGRLGLGKGIYDARYVPVLVESLEGKRIISVSCGNTTTFALTDIKHEWVGASGARYKELRDTGGAKDAALYMGAQTGYGICLVKDEQGEQAYHVLLEVAVRGYKYPDHVQRALFYLGQAAPIYAKSLDRSGANGDFIRKAGERWWSDLRDRFPNSPWAEKAKTD